MNSSSPSCLISHWIKAQGGVRKLVVQGRALSPSFAVPTEDTVFMRDENERREYVLSQHGLIFQGTCDYIFSIPWNFGQVSGQGPLGPLGPLAMQL